MSDDVAARCPAAPSRLTASIAHAWTRYAIDMVRADER